jgi:proline iminopeptidase
MRRFAFLLSMALAMMLATFSWAAEPYGIGLEGFAYPYPVSMLIVPTEGEALRLAYMDLKPAGAGNGRTVLLLHGRNFPSSYWDEGAGCRRLSRRRAGPGRFWQILQTALPA